MFNTQRIYWSGSLILNHMNQKFHPNPIFFITALFLDQLLVPQTVLSTIGTCVTTKWPSRGWGWERILEGVRRCWRFASSNNHRWPDSSQHSPNAPAEADRYVWMSGCTGCGFVWRGIQLECVTLSRTETNAPSHWVWNLALSALTEESHRDPIRNSSPALQTWTQHWWRYWRYWWTEQLNVQRSMQLFLKLMFLPGFSILVTKY